MARATQMFRVSSMGAPNYHRPKTKALVELKTCIHFHKSPSIAKPSISDPTIVRFYFDHQRLASTHGFSNLAVLSLSSVVRHLLGMLQQQDLQSCNNKIN
jgi:hypothetical protein